MKKRKASENGGTFWDFAWNLTLLVFVCTLVYLLYAQGFLDSYLLSLANHGRPAAPVSTAVAAEQIKEFPPAIAQATPAPIPATASPAPADATSAAVASSPAADGNVGAMAGAPADATAPPAMPAPATAGTAPASTPVAATATPEPAATAAPSVAVETPEPPITLDGLERRFWPRQVRLLRPQQFIITENGQQIGSASVPAGMSVNLIGIQGARISVQDGAMSKVIDAKDTDIFDRIRRLKAIAGVSADDPPAPSAPAPPAQ